MNTITTSSSTNFNWDNSSTAIPSTFTNNSYITTIYPYSETHLIKELNSKNKIIYDGVDITKEYNESLEELKKKARERKAQEEKNKPKPKDLIEKVAFNEKLERTIVKWKDGTVTTVHCSALDDFDKEKGIAMCFMKKAYDNRGCFNDFLKKWVEKADVHK